MSNAQNYNKALNLTAQSHTDKYNTTKTRVLATGVELSISRKIGGKRC